MAWEDFWKTVSGDPHFQSDGEGGGSMVSPESAVWNTASGYASPEDYLTKTRGISDWMAPFVDRASSGGEAQTMGAHLDDAGFVLPNAYGYHRGTGEGAFDLGWIPDENHQFATQEKFRQALAQQIGGGAGTAIPLADARKTYDNTEIPKAGISFDDYLKRQYQNARVVDVPGVGKVVVADGTNSFDWGLGDRSSPLQTIFGEILPMAAALVGGVGGLESILGSGVGGAMFDTAGAGADLFGQGAIDLGNYGASTAAAGGGGAAELASMAETGSSMTGEALQGADPWTEAKSFLSENSLAPVSTGDPLPPDLPTDPADLNYTPYEGGSTFPGGGGGGPSVNLPVDPADLTVNAGEQKLLEQLGKVAGKSDSGLPQDLLDKILKYGPLAMGALGSLQQRQATKAASSSLAALGGPQRELGAKILADFQNGTLTPADQAGIDEWTRNSLAQSRQFFAKTGRPDSTAAKDSEANIMRKAEEMKAQARQNLLATGIQALNVTDRYQAAAIDAELQGDVQAGQAITNFLNTYGAWMRALPTITGATKGA